MEVHLSKISEIQGDQKAAREVVERVNREHSYFCPRCSEGKKYGPSEQIPFVRFEVESVRKDKNDFWKASGRCSTCGHQVEMLMDLSIK